MSYVEKLHQDMINAMKSQDKERLTTIRMLKGAVDLEHINKKREINDELLFEIASRQVKSRLESIKEFEKGNRTDLIEKTNKEIEIIKEYLPEELGEDEIHKIIDEAFNLVNPTKPSDMGLIMREVTPKLKGRADMSKVSEIIKNRLNSI